MKSVKRLCGLTVLVTAMCALWFGVSAPVVEGQSCTGGCAALGASNTFTVMPQIWNSSGSEVVAFSANGLSLSTAPVPTDTTGAGNAYFSDYVGIQTVAWMRPVSSGTDGNYPNLAVCGSLAECAPLSVAASKNKFAIKAYNENDSDLTTTGTIYAENLTQSTNTWGFVAAVGNGSSTNYDFVGFNGAGTSIGFAVDNNGNMGVSNGIYYCASASATSLSSCTLYTNPGYVFEYYFEGGLDQFAKKRGASDYTGLASLSDVEDFVRANYDLPLMAKHKDGDLFERGDLLMASVEEAYLYLFQQNDRMNAIEKRLAALEQR